MRVVTPVCQPPSVAPPWPVPGQLRPPSSFLGLPNLELVCCWEGVHRGELCVITTSNSFPFHRPCAFPQGTPGRDISTAHPATAASFLPAAGCSLTTCLLWGVPGSQMRTQTETLGTTQ